MSNYFNKIKIWFRGLVKKQETYYRHGLQPHRDWFWVLTTFFISLCILGLISFYFYNSIKDGRLFLVSVSDEKEQIHIDTKLLKKTIDDITIRHATAELFRQNNLNLPDPSL